MNRIEKRFKDLKNQDRKGLITFIMSGDPTPDISQNIFNKLPEAGADFLELGMPFSDPMADGPIIQEAALRSLRHDTSLDDTLDHVISLRANDTETPVILMGYANPIHKYGANRFCEKASKSGVDGLIIVDIPHEELQELSEPARKNNLNLIPLVTPTTDADRLKTILPDASGFLYYVSITGVTGTAQADPENIKKHISIIREHTDLPIAIGFGIKTPEDVKTMSEMADAVVVGSAIVKTIAAIEGGSKSEDDVTQQIRSLSNGLK